MLALAECPSQSAMDGINELPNGRLIFPIGVCPYCLFPADYHRGDCPRVDAANSEYGKRRIDICHPAIGSGGISA